jgi:hypothetical protein
VRYYPIPVEMAIAKNTGVDVEEKELSIIL